MRKIKTNHQSRSSWKTIKWISLTILLIGLVIAFWGRLIDYQSLKGDVIYVSDEEGYARIYRGQFNVITNQFHSIPLSPEEQIVSTLLSPLYLSETQEIIYLVGNTVMQMTMLGENNRQITSLDLPGSLLSWSGIDTIRFSAQIGTALNDQASSCPIMGSYTYNIQTATITPDFDTGGYELQPNGTYFRDGHEIGHRYCPSMIRGYESDFRSNVVSHAGDQIANINKRYYFGMPYGGDFMITDLLYAPVVSQAWSANIVQQTGLPNTVNWSSDDRYIMYDAKHVDRDSSAIYIVAVNSQDIYPLLTHDIHNYWYPYWIH